MNKYNEFVHTNIALIITNAQKMFHMSTEKVFRVYLLTLTMYQTNMLLLPLSTNIIVFIVFLINGLTEDLRTHCFFSC